MNNNQLDELKSYWMHQVITWSLSPGAISDLLKHLVKACEFEFVPELSSHSLRCGLSTSAAREWIDFELIKKQGGWKNDATVTVWA